ncbi:hypothetical protein [Sphingobacterium hotanense]|uniref:Uncharacterized protein n=1 Tax=Sphingobacterium hotanense TaxID=649196 RepID=A0ABT7NT51_9SPHI|nr:hypothetical protein [Sphingobacterium hotanense]MDM1050374.1 hypothetical protein [Sphingobacterium hotanense]
MSLINNDESSVILECFKRLDGKYRTYLEREGRWLGGSLINILVFPSVTDKEVREVQVKMEIFNMLPNDIKSDVSHIIQV